MGEIKGIFFKATETQKEEILKNPSNVA